MSKRVVFVVYPDLQILDLTGPFEVFALANRPASGQHPQDLPGGTHGPHYELEVVSVDGKPVRSSGGLEIASDSSVDGYVGSLDTPGGGGWNRHPGSGQGRTAGDLDRLGGAPFEAGGIGVQRGIPACPGRPARWTTGHDPLGLV
ncbi:MAG TPA: hypothetical protein VNG12_08595, partial [Acidimicrobiales bacterium]|nr:hypothetical protein [Acidimicrobiales bacterium]